MIVDAKGLACPEPVIRTKKALKDKPESLTVIVDNAAAFENVTRFAEAMKYTVTSKIDDQIYELSLKKNK